MLINKALLSTVLDTRSGACSLWILGETDKHYGWVSAGGNDRVVIKKVMKSSLLVPDTVILTLFQQFLLACVSFCLVTLPPRGWRHCSFWESYSHLEGDTYVSAEVCLLLSRPIPGAAWGTRTDGVCVPERPDSWLPHGGRRGVLVLDSGLAAGDFSLLGPQA